MHARRWTNPPVRFIDLRRPAADRSSSPTYYRPNHLRLCRVIRVKPTARPPRFASRRRLVSRDKGASRRLVPVSHFIIGHKELRGLICGRTIGRAQRASPLVLLSSAHTKHSSPPPPPTTHTHTHTPSSSSYPSPHSTHYMSENQDAMKFKQGAGPGWRSQARCEPMEETANGYLEMANFKSAFVGSISDRLFHAMQPVS